MDTELFPPSKWEQKCSTKVHLTWVPVFSIRAHGKFICILFVPTGSGYVFFMETGFRKCFLKIWHLGTLKKYKYAHMKMYLCIY